MLEGKIDEKISIELVGMKYAEAVFQLTDDSRQYLREWLPWIDNTASIDGTKQFITAKMREYEENQSVTVVIFFQNKIAGLAGYNKIDWKNRITYIGYWLGQAFQGNGIMTKVAQKLTQHAFEELGLNKVEIHAAEQNIRSRSIPERLGFKQEGIIRQNEWLYDHFVNQVVYGMLADEWKR